ncbi:expressed methyltransferase [Micractinium conductrix]|uniref:Expressed methyltransferase n=1 Tax=Micractinium conductrix TaxID=554055 RepID=A0A2P6VE68_9CHLO|nr:expressed methyltransferase [Micractinium conductrix]|eukprot:PSC72395.1 expressed methyltransferase [Micractinium conductrix]
MLAIMTRSNGSSSSGSPRLFSEVHTDRAIRLLTLGLLCLVAAMVWSIRARQVGAGGNLALSTPPFGVTPPPALLVKAVQAAADAEFRRGKLKSWLEHMPQAELHYALVNVSREPFLYGSILQDEDSYQADACSTDPPSSTIHLLSNVSGGGAIVDVGSHFGYYSLLGASIGCTFVAVEPVPRYRAVLESNVRLNGMEAAGKVLPYAVGYEAATITMGVPAKGNFGLARVLDAADAAGNVSAGVANTTGWQKLQIPQRPMDEMLAEVALPGDVCLMKIDVEGREPSVVLSAPRLFNATRVRHVMLEFSPGFGEDGSPGLADMLSFLHDKGYRAWEIDWKRAKIGQPVGAIDPAATQGRPVDISTHKARKALIAAVKPRFNTNLWLSLAD